MSTSCRVLLLAIAVAGLAVVVAPAEEKSPASEVELKPIKYDDLKAAVRAQRGKVVVVDCWSSTCIPCMKMFPDMVKMQNAHAKDGLVCISLSTDPTAKEQEAALNFLKRQKATTTNYWIDEKPDFWAEKLDISGVPAVFIFDRQGRRAAKFDGSDPDKPFDHTDIEKVVEQLLKAP